MTRGERRPDGAHERFGGAERIEEGAVGGGTDGVGRGR